MNRAKLVAALQQIKAGAEEGLRAVQERSQPRSPRTRPAPTRIQRPLQVDFEKPLRPFMKTYAKRLSGPKKFALLLARLANGDLKQEVALSDIEAHWNWMTSLLEMKFNRFFPARAKDNDWVESRKKGLYNLRPAWRDVLKSKS